MAGLLSEVMSQVSSLCINLAVRPDCGAGYMIIRAQDRELTAPEPGKRKKKTKSLIGVVDLLTRGVLLCGRFCQALFIVFPAACDSGLFARLNGVVSPHMCWWLRDPWSSLAPNDLLSVLTSLGQAPDPACALSASEASGGQPLLIISSRCEPVTRNELPRPASTCLCSPGDRLALSTL